MGIVYADLRLSNPAEPGLDEITANAIVDPCGMRVIPNPESPNVPGSLALLATDDVRPRRSSTAESPPALPR